MKIVIADDSSGSRGGLRDVVERWLVNDADDADLAPEQAPVRILFASLSKQRVVATDEPSDAEHSELLAQPEFSARILDAIGAELLHVGRVKQAAPFIELALQRRLKLYGEDHPATAESLNTRARLKRMQGDLASAEKDVRRALAINSRVYGEDSYAACNNLTELAVVQLQAGEFEAAEKTAQRGADILEQLYLDDDPNATRLLDVIAWVQHARGDHDLAAHMYQRVLQLDNRPGEEPSLKYATHLANYADVLLSQGEVVEAERMYQAAIKIYAETARVPQHPDLIDIRAMYASLLSEQGKAAEARDQLTQLIKMDSDLRGDDHPNVGNDYVIRARASYELGDFKPAIDDCDTALGIYQKSVDQGQLSAQDVFIAEARAWKARAIVQRAKDAGSTERQRAGREAEQLAEPALRTFRTAFADDSVEVAIAGAILARALSLQGKDSARARALLDAALPIVIASRGEQSKIAALVREWLTDVD